LTSSSIRAGRVNGGGVSSSSTVGVVRAIIGLTGKLLPGAGLRSASRPHPVIAAAPTTTKIHARFMAMCLAAPLGIRQLAGLHERPYPAGMRYLTIIALLLAFAACSKAPSQQQPTAENSNASAPDTGIKGVHRENRGKPPPAALFNDPDGKPVRIADFAGKPVLVNLWATWCAPCVKELPTLDALARRGSVKVLAVSQDDAPHASVVAFLQAHKIGRLEPYQDPKMSLSGALGPDTVLPTTMLFDANGEEVWRYVGDLDWTSPEAARLLSEVGGAAPKS
jgi:thiol-disulfide isomerase/thioredoxin